MRKTGDGKVCQCESFAAVTERAALASGRWLGRGDTEGAHEAAISGMRAALDSIPISGRIVIGADGDDRALEPDVSSAQAGRSSISPSTRWRARAWSPEAVTARWR